MAGDYFGHPIERIQDEWVYSDTKTPMPEKRLCPFCKEYQREDGADPCLGHIEGADQACCGHGVTEGYVWYEELRERKTLKKLKDNR